MTELFSYGAFELARSFDGSFVAARSAGEGDGTPLLVCNALGATLGVWRRALIDVVRERRVFAWDHRGLFASAPPASDRFDPGAHAEDALAVADHFAIDRFSIISWSTGSRIAIELAHRYPERVASLVIVCGGFGEQPTRALRHLQPSALLPSVAGIAKHFAPALSGPFRSLTARPELVGLIRQSGMVGPTADAHLLAELLRDMATCDLRIFLRIYEDVAGDNGRSLLSSIEAPTRLIAGERDRFTPAGVMREMAGLLPDAYLDIYDRATHYLPIEYPGRLSDDLRKFLADKT